MKNVEHLGSSQLRKAISSFLTKAYIFDTFEKDNTCREGSCLHKNSNV